MNLTTEQLEQILNGAPDGATHVEILEDDPSEYWLLDSDELLWHWHKNPKDANRTWRIGIPELPVENIHDLSDLREILTLRQRVAELEVQVPKWISIEDELPPVGQECLFFRPLAENSGDEPVAVKVARVDHGQCWESTVPHGFNPCNPSDGYCHVTHWMPIPQPPKGEKQ